MTAANGKNLHDSLYEILLSYYNKSTFSGAAVAFRHAGDSFPEQLLVCCGFDSEKKNNPIQQNTFFDLASLTKPLVTVLSLLVLVDQKKIAWHDSLDFLLGRTVPQPLKKVKIEQLMSHSGGLPPHRLYADRLWAKEEEKKKEWLTERILRENPLKQEKGAPVYSDLGYLLLGFVVEKVTGQPLNVFWKETITIPLGLHQQLFYPVPLSAYCGTFVETGKCRFTSTSLKGLVHDENCRALGGVAGHAGLFGTTEGVLELCKEMLALYRGRMSKLPITAATFRKTCERVGFSDWATGFQLPSSKDSSSGNHFSATSIGHLGFTGTSFWIDPQRELIVVLLTNRTCKGPDLRGIKKLRPDIHNCIVEFLLQQEKDKGKAP